uniref:RING-type E3 ubiquitin transferase n=1 Tax=Davidia involucrata TaxID=16924 RepID=A0A5B6ZBJ3_DAVIN
MQGQRSAVGSLPETLSFDHGSTSSNAGIDQQICWNNMRNSAHNHLPDYVISPSDTTITYLNSTSLEGQSLSGWNLGEPSSSGTQNQVSHNERKTEHGWSSSMSACTGPSPVLEERRYEPANILSLNNVNVNLNSNQIANGPLFLQSSRSDAIPQDLNISAGFVECGVDDCQVTECPNVYKSGGSENVRISSASSSSNPFGVPSVSGGYLVEENDGRSGCSLDGRRLSCKRKALEGDIGQSSVSGSSSYFQHAESSAWHAVPAHYNACSGLSISTPSEHNLGVSPSEQVNPGLGLGVRGAASESPLALNVAGSTERSQRNSRVRINPSQQQDSVTANVFSTGGAVALSNFSSPHHSSRFLALNNSLELRSAPTVDNTSPQRRSVVHVPALRRHLQSSRWSGGSSSRPGNSSGSVISGGVDAAREESNSTSLPRNISEHPMFVPATELRNSAQNPPNWSLTGGNISIAGNVASTSQSGTISGVHPPSAPNWVPHRNRPQYPRRLSEFVRRSLLSSAGSESGGQSSNNSPLRSGPASSREMALSSGAGNQGHHLLHSRSAMLLGRQLDGAFGIPHSLRTLAAAGEGRSRLVSEIRNVLDLMRRGEGLQFEDVMILDQSVFFGMPDIHDRHRDMRLDVDNMSYEELLALEERIGYVSTGLSEETILKRLKQRKYLSIAIGAQLEVEPCCICQEEYNVGEDLGALECGHEFHADCIKQWLKHKNLCPICKTTALVT